MRNQARLKTLPEWDQQRIIDLCRDHSYTQAVAELALPREQGGLGLHTSRAALCRFIQNNDAANSLESRVNDTIERLRKMNRADPLDYPNAILRLLQERVLASLINDRKFLALRREFSAYLALRRQNHREAVHRLPTLRIPSQKIGAQERTSPAQSRKMPPEKARNS